MPGIFPGKFGDEERESGRNWPNPPFYRENGGTRPISPLDSVANRLKWPALRRASRLASSKMGHADATVMIRNRP